MFQRGTRIFALNWIGVICGCFAANLCAWGWEASDCQSWAPLRWNVLGFTGTRGTCFLWVSRQVAAKGVRLHLVLPAEPSNVWVLSTSYWFWRHERHKSKGAMVNGWGMVLVTGSLYLWWGRAYLQKKETQDCYFPFLPTVSVLPDLVGRIPHVTPHSWLDLQRFWWRCIAPSPNT